MSGRLLLVSGGARSGKSRYALQRARECGRPVLFVATGVATDAEMAARIARHRAERPADWTTLEARYDLALAIPPSWSDERCILVDDLSTWIANLLIERDVDESGVLSEVDSLIRLVGQGSSNMILVSAEVGSGLVPDNSLGRRFRDVLGLANQRLAAAADEVVLLVAGLPQRLKG